MDNKSIPVFKVEPVLVIVLTIITCGFYLIYWNIKVAEVFNAVSQREVISPAIAVISGLCTPVHIYFYYLAGQSLDDVGRLIGNPNLKDKSTMLLILGLFLPMVAAMIVQGHINEIYTKQ